MVESFKWKSRIEVGRIGAGRIAIRSVMFSLALGVPFAPTLAGPVPDYDFDWATIGAVGNPGLDESIDPFTLGRGSVDYRYRISKLEITTGQWMEYVNTFSTQGDAYADFGRPLNWGAQVDPTYDGPGRRWRLRDVPNAGRLPVTSLTWRQAARYTNWLHNNKLSSFDALVTGAYDTTTWGWNKVDGYTDDERRLPGAKYWIPTLDEWMKAAHYDPNKNGEGEGGWWLHPNGTDDVLTPGLPGEGGQTSGGLNTVNPDGEWEIPLGASEDVTSPWGLYDISGGADEWVETYIDEEQRARVFMGSWAGFHAWFTFDQAWAMGGAMTPESSNFSTSFRIASAIPGPGSMVVILVVCSLHGTRRKREERSAS